MSAASVRPFGPQRVTFPAALPVQTQAVVFRDDLQQRAARLWPEDLPNWQENRAEWIRAVQTVRASPRGWVHDVMERKHG